MSELTVIFPNEVDFHWQDKQQCQAMAKQCRNCGDSKRDCTCDDYQQRRCKQPVQEGFNVCRYHGAGKTGGIKGGRPIESGRFSKKLQKAAHIFSEAYEESFNDPDLLSLKAEISLLDAWNADLVALMAEGGITGSEAWSEMRDGLRILENGGDLEVALRHIKTAINKAERVGEIKDEQRRNFDLRRKLTDTERRRLVDMKLLYTPELKRFWEAQVFDAFLKTVDNDPRLVERFISFLELIPGIGITGPS